MFNPSGENNGLFARIVAKEPIQVIIQSTTNRIEGTVHIRPEERLKEEMNQPEMFIVITDAIVYDENHNSIFKSNFLVLNRNQVVWIFPIEETNE